MHKTVKLTDFPPDPSNANKGTQRGRGLLENSLQKLGAGRSVLADKNGVLIAGNKTLQTAVESGFENAIVVETDGTQLVVVKRTDLDLSTDAKAKELAIADNRIGEISLEWDAEVLSALSEEFDLSSMFFEDELKDLWEEWKGKDEDFTLANSEDQTGELRDSYQVVVVLNSEVDQVNLLDELESKGYKCRALIS